MDFRIQEDIPLVLDMLSCDKKELADNLEISRMTLDRWLSGASSPRWEHLDRFYSYATDHDIPLNKIKAQLYVEELELLDEHVLFHGSKSGISGPINLTAARANNDFGSGFYCGESLMQSAMFVTSFPSSSLYMLAFKPQGLSRLEFSVDQDWMLAVASFRGRMGTYGRHPRIKSIRERVTEADYIVAPIADNRMYEIIDQFIDGEITDAQCQHSLSATDLGKQYVFTTQKALDQLRIVEHCFLCTRDRARYEASRSEETAAGLAKAKAARRQYRNTGRYIEELLP